MAKRFEPFPEKTSVRTGREALRDLESRLAGSDGETPADPRARGAAAAVGRALAGLRAGAFLSEEDLARERRVLRGAAGREAPLVAYVTCGPSGSHDAWHAAAETGMFLLFARNTQEAVDLSLAARWAAERALVPGLVAMDRETAEALQDVTLPAGGTVHDLLGDPADTIETPTPAQEMLFGARRRRIPRWFDPEHPALHGADPRELRAAASAGRRPYLLDAAEGILDRAFDAVTGTTGRRIGALSRHALDGAHVVVVAMGAAVETAEAVADALRAREKRRVGVVGITSLRPFPARQLLEAVRGAQAVVVLERADAPLAGDPPLTREVRAALQRAMENGRHGRETHPGYPAWKDKDLPRLHTAVIGPEGEGLVADDLGLALSRVREGLGPLTYLGVDFLPEHTAHPKRQPVLDRIRRDYPDTRTLGLRATPGAARALPEEAVVVAVCTPTGGPAAALGREAAQLLQRLGSGRVRGRVVREGVGAGGVRVERIALGGDSLREPGAATPADLAVVLGGGAGDPLSPALASLAPGGTLLFASAEDAERSFRTAPASAGRIARDRKIELRAAAAPDDDVLRGEALLGALARAVAERRGEAAGSRGGKARGELLGDTTPEERERRVEAFRAGFDELHAVEIPPAVAAPGPPAEPAAPAAVRRLGRTDDLWDSLPRFHAQVEVPYRAGELAELVPDPYLVAGALPPLSSTFRDLTMDRATLPAFDPAKCTGCGLCWTACPDAAVVAAALPSRALLEAAMDAARERGKSADVLRSVLGKLAPALGRGLSADPAPATVGPALRAAFDDLMAKTDPPADRRQSLDAAVDTLLEEIGDLPAACTDAFFAAAEAKQKGTGALLVLGIDPDACKGCGTCVAVCEPEALRTEPQTPERVDAARRVRDALECLPDTPAEVLEAARGAEFLGEAAARMIPREVRRAMAGGDDAEAGSGERAALRLIVAAADSSRREGLRRRIREIEELQGRLATEIRERLAQALPVADLDALAGGLQSLGRPDVDLGALSARIEEGASAGRVDAAALTRLVDAARALADLRYRLGAGTPDGTRAGAGLVAAAGSLPARVAAFPHNPFGIPVMVDPAGDPGSLASGLLEGMMRTAREEAAVTRRARALLEPGGADRRAPGPGVPAWSELAPEERVACPLLLVVLAEADSGDVNEALAMLGTDLPLKTVVLADRPGDLALLAAAHRRVFVVQSSPGFPDHLVRGVLDAADFDGPALLRVHGPSPARDGFAPDRAPAQARLAVEARAFPLLRYDPAGEGVFGTRFDVSGNPALRAPWAKDADGRAVTFADWARTEARFAARFVPLADTDPEPLALDEYLLLAPEKRAAVTPVVSVPGPDGETVRLRVTPEMVAETAERLGSWRTLLEVAGTLTPFTEGVRLQVEKTVAAEHEAELAALRREYEDKLREAGAGARQELAGRLRESLLALAGHAPRRPGNGGGS